MELFSPASSKANPCSPGDGAYAYLCIKEFTKQTRHFLPDFQVGKDQDLLRLLAVFSQECAPLMYLAREGLKLPAWNVKSCKAHNSV